MKSGASDPFADDTADDTTVENADGEAQNAVESETKAESETEYSEQSDESGTPSSNTRQISREDLPFTLRRDNVKDERENVHQLFVQTETDKHAKDAERELESLIGEDVYRLDAREAIYLAGMQNLSDAATILRDWGYDL
ncbi:hypothetical protein [Haladaptatus caseinilyticus]|uniref:hypothetical protein n=1 Tax=Haladaptatus caseinilyticus TaxID=2993314 RepID=UPI00224A9C8D|nr:hypothetical protein [Haladaptatus caseinilyticus]